MGKDLKVTFMNYSMKRDDETLKEFIEYYKQTNTPIPNPEQYPMQFEFYVKMFEHYKTMQAFNG